MTSRAAAAALALLSGLVACQPVPSTAPSGTVQASSPGASTSALPPATTGSGAQLADALRDAISVDDILADLGRLDAIATANDGHRAAGRPGHEQSAELVAEGAAPPATRSASCRRCFTAFSQDAPSVPEIQGEGAPQLADIRDYKAMLLSPSGDVTAEVFALGFDPAAQPGDRNGIGCEPADWSFVPAGVIAFVQPGACRRRDVLLNAQAAGVVALVTSYPEWRPERPSPDAHRRGWPLDPRRRHHGRGGPRDLLGVAGRAAGPPRGPDDHRRRRHPQRHRRDAGRRPGARRDARRPPRLRDRWAGDQRQRHRHDGDPRDREGAQGAAPMARHGRFGSPSGRARRSACSARLRM